MRTRLFAAIFLFLTAVTSSVAIASDDVYDDDVRPDKEWAGCYKGARHPAVVFNYRDIATTTGSGKQLTTSQVKQTVAQAGKERNWLFSQTAGNSDAGTMLATLMVRGKHTIVLRVPYTKDKYSLLYADSTNMNYAVCGKNAYIHPNYNAWVRTLQQNIQSALSNL
ncbi:MAG: hypothetical protein LBK01_06420 [Burkholderiaceae bacterium]|jgi:hypothetical protein|nr:hypothetical protein [Burkholderiaceae bacterium]